jgi:hypothetical protein
MDTRDLYKLIRELSTEKHTEINLYDSVDVELSEDFVIETGVVGFTEDGIILHLDEDAMEMLDLNGILLESEVVIRDEEGNITSRDDDFEGFIDKVINNSDPFGMVYDAIKGEYGEDIRTAMQEMYDDIVIDSAGRLHPDDDFEQIISHVLDRLESDAVSEGAHSDHWDSKYDVDSSDPSVTPRDKERAAGRRRAEDDGWDPKRDEIDEAGYDDSEEAHPASNAIYRRIVNSHPELFQSFTVQEISDAVNDYAEGLGDLEEIGSSDVSIWTKEVIDDLQYRNNELAEIKKLALGHDSVDEGAGKALLGGVALIAAMIGGNKMHAHHLMTTEPQLVTLTQMRQEAEQKGDNYEVKQLDDRIKKTLDHISITGRPVMGGDGEPIDPRKPWAGESIQEAEYQGRKVTLNKPMAGDVKKSKVYVKKPDGKVVKVNFGDKNMRIKKSNPERRKSFRARHNCENPGPKWKARYWSCRAW